MIKKFYVRSSIKLNFMILKTLPKFLFAIFSFLLFQNLQAQTVLPLNGSASGSITTPGDTSIYSLTTNADGEINLSLSVSNNQATFVSLYDSDKVTVLGTPNYTYTGPLIISVDGLAPGKYYVKVYPYYTSGTPSFTVSNTLTVAVPAKDNEPNNTPAQADVLTLNDSITGHVNYYYNHYRDTTDWYKVTTNADGLLRLRLNVANNVAVYCTLYDKDGATVLSTNYTYTTEDINTDGLAAGTYYVAIYCYYNSQFAPYTLSDSLFTYNPVDSESNKYFSEARTILSNRVSTGHVGFYYNGARDTVDTYKINYTGTSGNLNLTFNLLPHIVDGSFNATYFEVYSDTAAAPLYTQYTYSNLAANLTGLSQGYYYIKVYEYFSGGQFEAYSITDSFTQVNKATISLAKASSPSTTCGSDSLTFNLGASHSPYTVRLYKDGGLTDSIITNSTTAAFTGLNDGNYYATVYGDGATDSAYSKTGSTQFLPVTPSGLSATNIGAHSATLNFSNLSCEANYVIQYKITGTSTYTTVDVSGTNGAYALAGLVTNTKYTFRVASSDPSNGLVSAYSDTATFTTLSDLPVTFLNFDGVLQDDKALLTWSTSQELNNKGFEVEKSYDGQTFTGIGFVNGAGNSSVVNTYNYTDLKVQSGSNYYRLRQEDIDGNFNYSSIIRLDFKQFSWAIFGNPVTSNSWIQLQLTKTSNVAIQVYSIDGKIINTINKGYISAGTYSIPLNLGSAPAGIYIVKLVSDNQIFSKKIIK
jgi:hypothetical protein